MATQVNHPFYSNNSTAPVYGSPAPVPVYRSPAPAPGGAPPPSSAPQRLALDNLIRRELRVKSERRSGVDIAGGAGLVFAPAHDIRDLARAERHREVAFEKRLIPFAVIEAGLVDREIERVPREQRVVLARRTIPRSLAVFKAKCQI